MAFSSVEISCRMCVEFRRVCRGVSQLCANWTSSIRHISTFDLVPTFSGRYAYLQFTNERTKAQGNTELAQIKWRGQNMRLGLCHLKVHFLSAPSGMARVFLQPASSAWMLPCTAVL